MKANELKIGDYVTENTYGVKRIGKTIAIKEKQVVLRLENYIIATSIKNIEPIPLTEEWLLKFKFEIKKGKFGNEYHFKNFVIHTSYANNFCFCWDNYIKTIYYIHEMQNLFYCLHGKELELKQ